MKSLVAEVLKKAIDEGAISVEGTRSFSENFETAPGHVEIGGRVSRIRLPGAAPATLIEYELCEEWGSNTFDHTEEGVVVVDEYTGYLFILEVSGQHAGKEDFYPRIRDFAKGIVENFRTGRYNRPEPEPEGVVVRRRR